MHHNESYRGSAIRVWTSREKPFAWSYTIDLGESHKGGATCNRVQTALIDGLTAARLDIDEGHSDAAHHCGGVVER
jgi:hypothetical protein